MGSAKEILVATNRPRSSASIPGKTRYILLKGDPQQQSTSTKKNNLRWRGPTKLEESLLRKRFPAQHHKIMRELARLELTTSGSEIYDDTESCNFIEDSWDAASSSLSFDADKITAAVVKSAPLITVLHRKKSSYMPATFRA